MAKFRDAEEAIGILDLDAATERLEGLELEAQVAGEVDEFEFLVAQCKTLQKVVPQLSLDGGGQLQLCEIMPRGYTLYLAWNPRTPERLLQQVYDKCGDESHIIEGLAQHPNTPRSALSKFARSEEIYVLEAYLSNPLHPPERLADAAREGFDWAKRAAAKNPNCPEEILNELSMKDDFLIKLAILSNPCTPASVLISMADRGIGALEEDYLLAHPNCPGSLLKQLFERDSQQLNSDNIALNPSCPESLLRQLILSPESGSVARKAVAENFSTPNSLLWELLEKYPNASEVQNTCRSRALYTPFRLMEPAIPWIIQRSQSSEVSLTRIEKAAGIYLMQVEHRGRRMMPPATENVRLRYSDSFPRNAMLPEPGPDTLVALVFEYSYEATGKWMSRHSYNESDPPTVIAAEIAIFTFDFSKCLGVKIFDPGKLGLAKSGLLSHRTELRDEQNEWLSSFVRE